MLPVTEHHPHTLLERRSEPIHEGQLRPHTSSEFSCILFHSLPLPEFQLALKIGK
jgi:hypothetical protein